MLFYDAINHGKAEAGPLSLLLCRKIGVENLVDDLLRHSMAGIRNRQHGVFARSNVDIERFQRTQFHLPQADGYFSARLLHGMVGVGDDVHGDLMNLGRVRHDHAAVRLNILLYFDVGGNRRPGQFQYLFENILDSGGYHLVFGLAAECENLFYKVAAPFARQVDLPEAFPLGAARREIVDEQFRTSR